MIIASCRQVRHAEQQAFAAGKTTPAALTAAVVRELERALRPALPCPPAGPVVVYAGKGGNARDAVGLAAAMADAMVLRCAPGADAASLLPEGCECRVTMATEPPEPEPGMLILDGLLGSGARGELRPEYAALVDEMNTLRARCNEATLVAIDIPTGLDGDTGQTTGSVVQADITCPIGCVKPGMLADGAEDAVGRLLPVRLPGIALAPETPDAVLTGDDPLVELPRRAYSCFKNRAGRVAIVAGSIGMLGAARLCAEAALKAGAGLVVLYCHREAYPLLAAATAPEVMVRPVNSYAEIDEPLAQALIIGPGLGAVAEAEAAALKALAHSFPGTVVLDADGLNLAAAQQWHFTRRMILTPHPGEMRRLASHPTASRRETVRRFLDLHPATLLLKGARSIIADGSTCRYNSTGGPFMANGGQGDALAGVIGALAAQGCPPLQAAAAGAYHCGLAAERARRKMWREGRGLTGVVRASDVIACFCR